ncbi:hypothetical protein WAI453_006060 [Rhynchosporium graminicola]
MQKVFQSEVFARAALEAVHTNCQPSISSPKVLPKMGTSCVYASSPESDSSFRDSSSSPPTVLTNQYAPKETSVLSVGNEMDTMLGVFDDLMNENFPIIGLGSGDLIARQFDTSVYSTALTTPGLLGLGDPWAASLFSHMTPPLNINNCFVSSRKLLHISGDGEGVNSPGPIYWCKIDYNRDQNFIQEL